MEDIKKKIEYIWYYYKIHIIVIVSVVALLIYSFINQGIETKYDHSIAIVSAYNYPSETQVEKIVDCFEDKFDGTFEVIIYNLALGEVGQDEVLISKLGIDIANNISEYYLIEDYETFENATNNLEFSSVDNVDDIDWLSNLGVDGFYYCVR